MRTQFGIWLVATASALAADQAALDPAFQIVREAVKKDEVPGAIVLVARRGTILRHEAMGWSDPLERIPFTTNTLCWIASITKPVTVAAAMVLIDQRKLALDDPIEKFLPEFKEQTDGEGKHHSVTVRHIMTHTSGLPVNPPTRRSGWPIGGALDPSWLQKDWDEIMRDTAGTPLRFAPGSKVEYSNGAFFVLGRIVEKVSGRPFAAHVKQAILDPLGMDDTYFAPPTATAQRVSPIYAETEGKRSMIFRFNPKLKIVNTAPDGGLFSYPEQIAKFAQMFLDNDGHVLSKDAVAQMLTEQKPGRGLGWALEDGVFMHEGSSGTLVWGDPKTGVVGALFLQFRDRKDASTRVRNEFRAAVQKTFVAGELK